MPLIPNTPEAAEALGMPFQQQPAGRLARPGAGRKPTFSGPQPEEMGFGDYAADAVMGTVGGVGKALNETSDFIYDGANYVDNALGDHLLPEENPFQLPEYKPKSMTGEIASGITQFATGFIGAGKFLKAAKLAGKLSEAGKLGATVESMAQGALADFVAFDPHDSRFSNMLQEMGVKNEFVDYLAADPDDSAAEGRFKNAVEGLALGAVTEPILALAGKLKLLRRTAQEKGPEEALRLMPESSADLEALLNPPGHVDGPAQILPQFNPKEKVEVYSKADNAIKAVEADEKGLVTLGEGERFVVEKYNPKRPDVPLDFDKLTGRLREMKASGKVDFD
jgi:hypothetical protein